MYQQSVDRANGTARSDFILLIGLILTFFLTGTAVYLLEAKTGSRIPRYIMIFGAFALLYLIYRLRLVGYRYTVFYKEPEPTYDPRFDDMMLHEDYPYPVGTIVFERIVSAKGTIVLTIDKGSVIALASPGVDNGIKAEKIFDMSCARKERAHVLYYKAGNEINAILFVPDDEFVSHVSALIENAAAECSNE